MSVKPVLLVEDSDDDVLLLGEACRKAQVKWHLVRTRNGCEAIEYLSGQGVYSDRQRHPLPCLVISDLKMPRGTGLDLLQWMRHRPEFTDIPVLMLTASPLEGDEARARELGCSHLYLKPSSFRDLAELILQIDEEWFAKACLGSCSA